jgi:hypothetical protein
MGSPFYIENWIPPTLGYRLVGFVAGGLLGLGGSKSRQVGASILAGTFLGGGLFVLLFGLLVLSPQSEGPGVPTAHRQIRSPTAA